MKHWIAMAWIGCIGLMIGGCEMPEGTTKAGSEDAATFADDVAFLRRCTGVVVLSDAKGEAQVAVCPGYQGRVMTSTAAGGGGLSFGWLNRELIASGERKSHINVFGGEDRFWMGPEGGQFSIFFRKDDPFDLTHWQTPEGIDWGAYDVVVKGKDRILFRKAMKLRNYSNFDFDLEVSREICLLSPEEIGKSLGVAVPAGVSGVGYLSDNKITNKGKAPWKKETGLLSIWILGMFTPTPDTTIVIPFQIGPVDNLGPIVNDAYFGKVPEDRLIIKDGVMYFRGDGTYRSKIGLSRKRCKPTVGSYDAGNKVLTLVQYSLPEGATDYVNSMWQYQSEPYAGDAVNSYNDGPPEPRAKPLGPFYELETSSPAAALSPGQSLSHVHKTMHLQGPDVELDKIATATLGVGLGKIKGAFGK